MIHHCLFDRKAQTIKHRKQTQGRSHHLTCLWQQVEEGFAAICTPTHAYADTRT